MRPDEPCSICCAKHLAKARGLLMETSLGHEESFWFALGEIALAEDHMVKEHLDIALDIRGHRLELQTYPKYDFPFKELILRATGVDGYDLRVLLDDKGFIGGQN